MSLEQRHGQPINQRADIYALGLIQYRLLASRIPPSANLRALVRVAARALSVETAQRYATATEFAEASQASRKGGENFSQLF